MDDNKIFKETEQVINITAESKATVRTNITVYSYDKNTAKFLFRLTKNSAALPMSNSAVISIALNFGTSGKAVLDAVVEDELEGLVSMVIPEEFLGYEGTVTGGVYINYSNGQSLDCGYFTFSMKRSMIDELTPEMPAYYVEGFENLRVEINEKSEEMKTKLSELDTIFKDLDVYNKAQVDSKVNGLKPAIDEVTAQLAQTAGDVKKRFLKPLFIEYFASFNKFGIGTPDGIANYTGGNYVLTVSGNAGESFLTVLSGNIADAGLTKKWACVLKNDDGIFSMNKVIGTDGVNKINLLKPLTKNVVSGLLGNLHDAPQGQHYTELGYYAFAQHLYFSNPRYSERNEVIAQFLEDDTSGKWLIKGVAGYNAGNGMLTSDNTYRHIGSKVLSVYAVDVLKTAEWEENINGYKGYVEAFVGTDSGAYKVEFYLDDVLVDSQTHTREVNRIVFPFEYANKGKIKIIPLGPYPQYLYIGRVSWFVNEKYSKNELIKPNMKVIYIGDSWGEFHNKAVKREIERLMLLEGGTPSVLDFSKGGHTSTYAKSWFGEYIVKNKPDVVIIEYFTNDFNSISGAVVLPTFTAPDGTQQDMNITSLTQYQRNIQSMIDIAIENGIQPIVIMPASTDSNSQSQVAANNNNDLWNGNKITNDTPYFQTATLNKAVTNSIESNGSNDIIIKSKAMNSSERKGVKIDSDINLTGGNIGGFYNNGVYKSGVKHDGTVDSPALQIQPRTADLGATIGTRGVIYNKSVVDGDDILCINIRKADGTFARKKIQLID